MRFLLLCLILVLLNACAGLPAPKNANGSINPTVAVGEIEVAYSNATAYAASYATTCHKDMTTIGCSQATIDNLKSYSDRALADVFAAEKAVRALPAGATTGAETPIATANASIAKLKDMTPKH